MLSQQRQHALDRLGDHLEDFENLKWRSLRLPLKPGIRKWLPGQPSPSDTLNLTLSPLTPEIQEFVRTDKKRRTVSN
jgi:hypothetical protein